MGHCQRIRQETGCGKKTSGAGTSHHWNYRSERDSCLQWFQSRLLEVIQVPLWSLLLSLQGAASSKLPVSSPLRSPLWAAVIPPALTKTGCNLPSILEGPHQNKKIVGLERLQQILTPSLFILFPSSTPFPSVVQTWTRAGRFVTWNPDLPTLLGALFCQVNCTSSVSLGLCVYAPVCLLSHITISLLCFNSTTLLPKMQENIKETLKSLNTFTESFVS